MSFSRVQVMGKLGRDPEIKRTQGGKLLANLSLAVEKRWKDTASGEWKKRTEWIPVVIWNEKLAELVEQYARKGDNLYVEGEFQTREWGEGDAKKQRTEVVIQGFDGKVELCGGRKGGDAGGSGDRSGGGGHIDNSFGSGSTSRASTAGSDLDDEIPF